MEGPVDDQHRLAWSSIDNIVRFNHHYPLYLCTILLQTS
jgi:hypothetical protein